MLLTRTGCEPPREVATGRVHSDLTRAAVDVGFHLARRKEFIKARVAASSMCRALRADNQSLVGAQAMGCSFCLASEITRRDRCTTEMLELQDFQFFDP
jgi:hypothetical protein